MTTRRDIPALGLHQQHPEKDVFTWGIFEEIIRHSPHRTDSTQIKLAKSVDQNPLDMEARFELIDSMADDAQCQWIIFMHESGKDIRRWARHAFEHRNGGGSIGSFEGATRNSLNGTGIMAQAGGGSYPLRWPAPP